MASFNIVCPEGVVAHLVHQIGQVAGYIVGILHNPVGGIGHADGATHRVALGGGGSPGTIQRFPEPTIGIHIFGIGPVRHIDTIEPPGRVMGIADHDAIGIAGPNGSPDGIIGRARNRRSIQYDIGPASCDIIAIFVGDAAPLHGPDQLTVVVIGIRHLQAVAIRYGGHASGGIVGLARRLLKGVLGGNLPFEPVISITRGITPGIGDAGKVAFRIVGVRRAESHPVSVGAHAVINISPGLEGAVAGISAPDAASNGVVGITYD